MFFYHFSFGEFLEKFSIQLGFMESSLIGVGAKIVLMELMAFGVGGEEEDGVSVFITGSWPALGQK